MANEPTPFTTKIIRLLEGDLFTFTVDARGLYVDAPNLYCVVALRPTGMSLATMTARMNAVCMLHNWAAARGIDLLARIRSLDLFRKDEIAALRTELRVNLLTRPKQPRRGGRRKARKKVVTNGQWRTRCAAVRDYVAWHVEDVIQRMSSRDERLAEARERLKDFRNWIIEDITVRKAAPREGLDEQAQEIFLRAITPGDASNPLALRHQHRNHALWLTYYDGGVRRSEALGLKCIDLSLHADHPILKVHRRPDDPEYPRVSPPRTKTLPHPVEMTPRLCRALHTYMVGHRKKYAGAKRSPYVFFGQMGKPLSVKTIAYMYGQLRLKVPGLPKDFTTHLVRYTWNDRYGDAAENLGLNKDHEKMVRNFHQGWTPTSEQGARYQIRRNRKLGHRIAVKMQDAATNGVT